MRFIFSLLLSLSGLAAFAQATLPTSFDFVTAPSPLPAGWTTSSTSSYSSGMLDNNGTTSRAGKLQATGHQYTIEFFDDPGTVQYNLKSYGTASFLGTLIVEESVNGTSWSTLHTFGDGDFGDTWTQFSETPNATSRFIRFNLTNKISGTNAGLDDVSISVLVSASAEINAVFLGNGIPSGSSIQFGTPVGTPTTVKVGIENLGTQQDLTISGVQITGSASASYTVANFPSLVSPTSADTIEITFDPAASGNQFATLEITNNDGNESPYIIDLNGIGGTTSSEPAASPTGLNWNTLKTYRLGGGFTASDAASYLVLFSKSPITTDPQDGQSYELGEGIGNGKVAYIGSATNFNIREAVANTTFYVNIYGFNGSGNFTNYRTSDPLSDSVTTPIVTIVNSNYYQGIDPMINSFVTDLQNTINTHNVRFYSNYDTDMIPPFLERDTVDGKKVITAVYSGENVVYDPPFGWSETGTNREHTLPASWMPTAGNTGTPEYQDFHHLFPTKATANGQRSNHPLGIVVNVTNSHGAGKVGQDANGNTVYEPRDAQKGDAARAIFYMQTSYHTEGGNDWGFDDLNSNGPNQRLQVLIDWHLNDLPTPFERARNDYMDSLQQNRNPFIDSAHWVCYINFDDMSWISTPDSGCLAATQSVTPVDTVVDTTINSVGAIHETEAWNIYPNPAKDLIWISGPKSQSVGIEIFSAAGSLVRKETSMLGAPYALEGLEPGIYLLRIADQSVAEERFFKLVID